MPGHAVYNGILLYITMLWRKLSSFLMTGVRIDQSLCCSYVTDSRVQRVLLAMMSLTCMLHLLPVIQIVLEPKITEVNTTNLYLIWWSAFWVYWIAEDIQHDADNLYIDCTYTLPFNKFVSVNKLWSERDCNRWNPHANYSLNVDINS